MSRTNDNSSEVLVKRHLENMQLSKVAYPDGSQSPTHWHENARLVFVVKGAFTERYDRRERQCVPSTVIYRPPDERHSDVYQGGGVTCISADISRRWCEDLRVSGVLLEQSAAVNSPFFAPLIARLNEELTSPDDLSDLAIEMIMFDAAIGLYRRNTREKGTPQWLKRAEEFIQENATGKLTLCTIAAVAGVHKVHLARTFRQVHNSTVAEYIRWIRINAARSQLAIPDIPLCLIAVEAGFSDQSHFSRVFKRRVGMTPAEYRRDLNVAR